MSKPFGYYWKIVFPKTGEVVSDGFVVGADNDKEGVRPVNEVPGFEMQTIAVYTQQPAQAAVLEGWKLVPDASNMTDEQAEAIAKVAGCCGGIAYEIYRAALNAAPEREGGV